MLRNKTIALAGLLAIAAAGCGTDDHDDACDEGEGHDHDHGDGEEGECFDQEVFTTVVLTFTPAIAGGTPIVATWTDSDGDGGNPPMIDAITLPAGGYKMGVRFENRLEDPVEDVTVEIMDEADEHQVFFTGTAVSGPASEQPMAPLVQNYADRDVNTLPIGLDNSVEARAGMGTLTVTLRHLPPLNDAPRKTATLADEVKMAGGSVAGIAGATDITVDFPVTVQ